MFVSVHLYMHGCNWWYLRDISRPILRPNFFFFLLKLFFFFYLDLNYLIFSTWVIIYLRNSLLLNFSNRTFLFNILDVIPIFFYPSLVLLVNAGADKTCYKRCYLISSRFYYYRVLNLTIVLGLKIYQDFSFIVNFNLIKPF